MKQILKRLWCRMGGYRKTYVDDRPWCPMSIAGCEHWHCEGCGKTACQVYADHPHTHKYPEPGECRRLCLNGCLDGPQS